MDCRIPRPEVITGVGDSPTREAGYRAVLLSLLTESHQDA
jgi:hypothetical protein